MPSRAALAAILLLFMAIPAVIVHLECDILPDDDAYITYRYADRLAETGLVSYNDGERVFGISTPLYFAWLGALKKAFPNVPTDHLAVRTNLIWFILTGAGICAAILRLTGGRAAGLATGALVMLHPAFINVSIGGMESFMFLALFSWSICLMALRREKSAAILAGLSALARPEAVPCALALAPLACRLGWKRALPAAAIAAAPPVGWALYSWLAFGSPIPHCIIAKLTPLYPRQPFDAVAAMIDLIGKAAAPSFPPGPGSSVLTLIVLTAASVSAILGSGTRRLEHSCVVLWFWSAFAFYGFSNPLMMTWYAPIFLAPLCCLLVSGTAGLASLLRKSAASSRQSIYKDSFRPANAPAAGLAFAVILAAQWAELAAGGGRFRSAFRDADPAAIRVAAYSEAGRWLRSIDGRSPVAAPEIGALGYAYGGPILDVCGLVSPAALPFLPVPADERGAPQIGAISPDLVLALRPVWIVTIDIFAAWGLYRKPWFPGMYEEIRTFRLPAEIWGCREVRVFRIRSADAQPDNSRNKTCKPRFSSRLCGGSAAMRPLSAFLRIDCEQPAV